MRFAELKQVARERGLPQGGRFGWCRWEPALLEPFLTGESFEFKQVARERGFPQDARPHRIS
jgi:hypothetical protein